MESACQVKGCKANKKVSKSLAHDEARGHRENNNVNCSDDENNDEIKKNTKKHSKPTTNSNFPTNNNNNNSNHHNNNNSSVVNNKNLSSSATTTTTTHYNKYAGSRSDVSYNQVVSGGKTSTNEPTHNRDVSSYKTATASLPYNKVVSSGKTVLDDCTYDKILAEIKTSLPLTSLVPMAKTSPSTTLTTTLSTTPTTTPNNNNNNVLSYNQVVINAKDSPSSYLSTPSYISYNKIVSGNDDIASSISSSNKFSSSSSITGSSNFTLNEVSDKSLNKTITSQTLNETTPKPQQQQQQQQQPQNQQQYQQQQQQKLVLQPKSNSEVEQRRAVLSYEQVCRLNDVMNEVVSIHGRGNFPTLEVRLRDLVTVVKSKLEEDPSSGGAGMKVRDIRLNGGAATHVLATESQPYNDLDLIFGVELTSSRNYDKVKAAVLCSLFDLLPEGVSRKRITTCSLKEAYVSKMVKVNNDGDRWSLISLGNSRGHRNVELKFVDTMRRQFEFSVDSFQIILDSLLQFHADGEAEISEPNHPTVVGESVYGDFHEALYHLQKKLISTRHPEEIRGGGLLKYCNLLVKMYKPAQPEYIKTLERYMCSRFFIDFPDISQQKAKLENYLWNHFVGVEEEALRYQYLMLLHSVVEESTVCLMGHERRQTLALIEGLAYQVLCQGQQRLTNHQAAAPAYVYANGYYYAPVIPTACYTCTCNSWMACSS